jgi:hypothetical protein
MPLFFNAFGSYTTPQVLRGKKLSLFLGEGELRRSVKIWNDSYIINKSRSKQANIKVIKD